MATKEMKENQHVQPVVDVEAGTVTFRTRGHPDIVLHAAKLHPDVMRRAALVGMAQVRIVDAAAVGMTDDDGNIIPEAGRIALKHERMAALVEHYETGTAEWSRVGQGGGGRSITVEAIARVRGITYDAAKAETDGFAAKKFNGDTKKALAFLRDGKRVQDAIAAIRAERTKAPKVDADSALDELSK
jgi:hypothetical protein